MFNDPEDSFENGESRLVELLQNGVDGFLASADESDFIFEASDDSSLSSRRLYESLFFKKLKSRSGFSFRNGALLIALSLAVVAGIFYFLAPSLIFSPSVDSETPMIGATTVENRGNAFNLEAPAFSSQFSPVLFCGRGLEVLDSFSQKYWIDDMEVVFDLTEYLTSWRGMGDGDLSLFVTNKELSGDSFVDSADETADTTNLLQGSVAPEEIIMSALSVSALVFTIEKFYNGDGFDRGVEL